MRYETTGFCAIAIVGAIFLMVAGCDLFEDDGDWSNDVTIRVYNRSDCLFTLFIDGNSQGSVHPEEDFEKTGINRGIHYLEAYPWNDSQFSCDESFTPYLNPGDIFEWHVTNEGGCDKCPPTPTPPLETPTPEPAETF